MAESKQEWERFLPPYSAHPFRSEFAAAFAGQTVCIAGAAGYIGSALVKALAHEPPGSIILLDSSEHGLFEIQRYMEVNHPTTNCEYVLASVDDTVSLAQVFSRFHPRIVFHAAAFKHVGLLERNPFAAIENNTLGTNTIVHAAQRHGVPSFVLVSTDKAVNPHSVMGVSKRLAELITLSQSRPTFRASAIRLANVIGSTGSVLPIFLDQIANGQPLSITHPEASRYFLSCDEAVTAILAAGAAACGGMILLPEFNASVRIADLADFLSHTHSRSFTGLRPGEKLSEDLIGQKEKRVGTVPGPLTVIQTSTLSQAEREDAIERLSTCLALRDRTNLLRTLRHLVPGYVPSTLMQG